MIGLLAAAGETRVSGVAQYDFRGPPPGNSVGVDAGSGGCDMEDVLRRLGSLEKDVSVIKADAAGIVMRLPDMASKADVAPIPYLATKADVMAIRAELPYMATKADVSDAKTSIVQWIVGTIIAVAALTFTIAKFIH
jgi:hypothetical protein